MRISAGAAVLLAVTFGSRRARDGREICGVARMYSPGSSAQLRAGCTLRGGETALREYEQAPMDSAIHEALETYARTRRLDTGGGRQ